MGENKFKQTVSKWRNSPVIIRIFIVAVCMTIIGSAAFIEDYTTSLEGYKMYPTRKAHDWVIPIVAFLPQIGQMGFAYIFMSDTDKKWGLLVALALHVADVYCDVLYKTIGGDWVKAFIESELIFTLGSEIMLSAGIGLLLETLPDAIKQYKILQSRTSAARRTKGGQPNSRQNNNRSQRSQPQRDRQQPLRSPQLPRHPGERNFQMVGEDED